MRLELAVNLGPLRPDARVGLLAEGGEMLLQPGTSRQCPLNEPGALRGLVPTEHLLRPGLVALLHARLAEIIRTVPAPWHSAEQDEM